MVAAVSGALGVSFKRGANEQAYRLFQWQQRDHQNRERRQKQEASEDQTSELLDVALTFATSEELEAFSLELETYDVAAIEALQENAAQIERVEDRLEQMLQQAHQLPDGRRVFKTEDGFRVFDEHGDELESSTFDPDQIPDDRIRWETYAQEMETHQNLIQERSELLEYQEKLDFGRDELDAGDITAGDFDAMQEDLRSSMPDTVRSRIPGMEVSTSPELELITEDLDISADMVPIIGAPGFRS